MAVTRPLKEGSVTTYQQKVALGFPDILASEMDADLDTIYAAWNGNVGTANLVDGSVTYAKLAPDAQMWRDTGTTLVPGTSFATRVVAVPGDATAATMVLGQASVKGRVTTWGSGVNTGTVGLLTNRNFANANAQDDPSKPSWAMLLRQGDDQLWVSRSPAGSTTQTNLLVLDATGQLTLSGTSVILGSTTAKGRMQTSSLGANLSANRDMNVSTQDDATKPSWVMALRTDVDWFLIQRAPAGSTTLANPLFLDGSGNLTISGANATKASGTTWANPSDPRLKDDVAPYGRGLADVVALDPITYRLKAAPDGPTCYGFDAARVRDVFPECVSEIRMKLDPADDEETDGVLAFDMHPVLVALVNAVKELAARR